MACLEPRVASSGTFGNMHFSESTVYTYEHEFRVHANSNTLDHEVLAAQEHGFCRTGRDTRRRF